jgi:hypothetical protein
MYKALANNPSDHFSPAWRQMLVELDIKSFFGESLKSWIAEIFSRNQITPAVALDELRKLLQSVQNVQTALQGVTSAFSTFKIGKEELAPGACEIGILVPRAAINNNLSDLAGEMRQIGFILDTFSEIATGKKDKLSIKTISSTDFMLYLQAALPYAACFAVAIERTAAFYKQLLEIRKLHAELQKQGVPDERTSGIKEWAEALIEDGLQKIAQEIVDKFYEGADKARKNELINAAKISLNKIANRLDRGYNLEVRAEPLQKAAADDKKAQKASEQIAMIQAATENMEFMKLEGPPILSLPENKKEEKKKDKV